MARTISNHDQMIAKRLRVVRQSKSVSQRELARRTGVSSGTISQIESLAMQPSVAVLKKILDGVPMDLATFFSFEIEENDTPVFGRNEHIDIGAPGVQYFLIAAQRPNRNIQMLHEFYQPGCGSGRRQMSHIGEECAVVISGTLELTIENEIFVLNKGEAYYFSSSTSHKFRNIGKDVCEVVSACTPPTF